MIAITSSMKECRAEILALANKHYFNFGGLGTLPTCSLEAIVASYQFAQTEGPFSNVALKWFADELRQARACFAKEMNVMPHCVAITHNVTEGCNIALWGISWIEGDELVMTDCEHNGVVLAVESLVERFGIKLKTVAIEGKSDAEILLSFKSVLGPKTKLVLASHVLWNRGQVLPVRDIAELCHRNGTLILLDGAQSFGMMPVDVVKLNCDFYAVTGHKWMCSPEGVGALYIRESLIPTLKTTFIGWRSNMLQENPNEPDASKFEGATSAFALLAGFRAAVDFHNRWGSKEDRFERILALAQKAKTMLKEIPHIKLLDDKAAKSGLVCFQVQGMDQRTAVERLESKRVFLRTIPTPDCIRASIHYFSNEEDLSELQKGLASLN